MNREKIEKLLDRYLKRMTSVEQDKLVEKWLQVYENTDSNSTYNNFTMSKSISLFLNFWHSLPSTQGGTYAKGRPALSSGFRIAMDNNRLQLNVTTDDIFKSATIEGQTYY